MATVLLRIDNTFEGVRTTDRFLLNCTTRQESILRRANRRISNKDKTALFLSLFCAILPQDETLQQRKQTFNEALDILKDEAQLEENNLSISLVTSVAGVANIFFTAPYGIFKVTRSPMSLLDSSNDFRITQVTITNNIDTTLLRAAII